MAFRKPRVSNISEHSKIVVYAAHTVAIVAEGTNPMRIKEKPALFVSSSA
jgi:hypothetical protein